MKKVALLVGVDIYEDPNIAPLGCAARDARELGVVLRDRLGFTVEVLTDVELSRGKNVISTLRRLGKELSEDDIFLFYFSGHGKSVADRDQLFLLPHADAASVASGATGEGIVSYQQLKGATANWPGVRRGFIFDACRSPLEIKKDGETATFEGEVVYRDPGPASSRAAKAAPLVILNSCHDSERAEELKGYQGGHGLFSAALLETFKQHHEQRQPVVIDESLSRTVGERMRQLARKYGSRETEQQPLFIGHGARDLRLFDREDQREVQRSEQVEELVRAFEGQFGAGRFERPLGDNCKDTLTQLVVLGCSAEVLQELSPRLNKALEEEKAAGRKQRDEQRIEAARLIGTKEGYAQYLASCEDCAHSDEAKEAIRRLDEAVAGKEEEKKRTEDAASSRRAAEEEKERAEAVRWKQAEQEKEALAAQLRATEDAALEAEKTAGCKERDEQRIKAARLAGTVKGYVQYLASCEDCAHRDEAKEAIKELKLPPPSPVSGEGSWKWIAAVCVLVLVMVGFNFFWGKQSKEEAAVIPPPESAVILEAVPAPEPVPSHPPTYRDAETGMEFALVEGGSFQMGDTFGDGDPEEKPIHEVRVRDYYLGKYEVTQGEWESVMESNRSRFQKGPRYPVENVSWKDVQMFIDKLNRRSGKNYRLPTEAEWEYAARSGGKVEKWSGVSVKSELGDYAWYRKNSRGSTLEVGTKKPNGLGLYDMSGNVLEWCEDWYGEVYYKTSPRDNPQGPSSGEFRVIRGGSWGDNPLYLRAAFRNSDTRDLRTGVTGDFSTPGLRLGVLGFRLALSPD